MKEKIVKFASGGKRDEAGFNFNFFSVSPIGLKRLAQIHYEGDTRYGYGNWRKGLPFSNIMNHAMNHLFLYLKGDKSQDNLAKVTWGMMALMHLEETKPYLNDLSGVWSIDLTPGKEKIRVVPKKKRGRKKGSKKLSRRQLDAIRRTSKKKTS